MADDKINKDSGSANRIDQIEAYALQHGLDSDPDHEIGDLQLALRLCWKRLTEVQRSAVSRELVSDHSWDLSDED